MIDSPTLSAGPLKAQGKLLESGEEDFGLLRESSPEEGPAALRAKLEQDGYVFLRGLFTRQAVLAARKNVADKYIAAGCVIEREDGALVPTGKPFPGIDTNAGLASACPDVQDLIYGERAISFFEGFLGGEVLHYTYTWMRSVVQGHGTPPHVDRVYMGRGTRQLMTLWTPLGDTSLDLGGLMVLEGSHTNERLRQTYASKDVDQYCANRPQADEYASGKRWWDGWLTKDPVGLRRAKGLGGRWLSANYKAGDVMIFGPYLVHGSLDNNTNLLRLSTDSRYQLASEPADGRWIGSRPPGHGPGGKVGVIC